MSRLGKMTEVDLFCFIVGGLEIISVELVLLLCNIRTYDKISRDVSSLRNTNDS